MKLVSQPIKLSLKIASYFFPKRTFLKKIIFFLDQLRKKCCTRDTPLWSKALLHFSWVRCTIVTNTKEKQVKPSGKERSVWPLRCKGLVEINRELKEKELQKFKTTYVQKAHGCHNFLIYMDKSAGVSSLEQN